MTDEEKKRQREINDIKTVLSTSEGRRFYWNIMERCGVFKDKFIEDTNLCYFLKGQRSVGLRLFHDVFEAEPTAFQQMQQERKSKKTRENINVKREIETKDVLKTDSPSLPKTGLESSEGEQ